MTRATSSRPFRQMLTQFRYSNHKNIDSIMHDHLRRHFTCTILGISNLEQIYQDTKLVRESSDLKTKPTVVALSDSGTFVAVGTFDGKIFKTNLSIQGKQLSRNKSGDLEQGSSQVQTDLELVEDINEKIELLKFDPTSNFLVVISCIGKISVCLFPILFIAHKLSTNKCWSSY